MTPLSLQEFLSACEMVQNHLRIAPERFWSAEVCQLKFASLKEAYPEVSLSHFWWACERWIQGTSPGFATFPTWDELMAVIYHCVGDRPVRRLGFREDLPDHQKPQEWQLALLPAKPLALPVDSRPFVPPPPRDRGPGALTPESAAAKAVRVRLEMGLITGRWSREEFGGGVDPSPEFLERLPQFKDRKFRALDSWDREGRLCAEGLAAPTVLARAAAARCVEGT